jgi:ABC-type molybdenum transport system ATPase subunit/photorepair protein PhrA
MALLKRFGMEGIAAKRNPSLTADERFLVMVLRAAAVQEAILVLDRPFEILTGLYDGRFLKETLERVDDLIAEAHIFDYTWEKQRYWDSDDAEN